MRILVFLFLLGYFKSSAQVSDTSNLFLHIGPIYRITPFSLSDYTSWGTIFPVYLEQDKQLTGTGISFGGSYLFKKARIAVSINNSFRYDHLYYDLGDPYGSNLKEVRRIILDNHFAVEKQFKIRNNKVLIGLEYSLMNRGTTYLVKELFITNTGDTSFLFSAPDFSFSTIGLSLGYQVKQLRLELNTRFAENPPFPGGNSMLLPEIRISYLLPLKMKELF